jgi:APA family basic amino acid/polyamine antiporter
MLGKGSASHFAPAISLTPSGLLVMAPALASGLIFVMFAFSGWNAAAYIGGEIKNPQKNMPRALVTGTIVVIALYVAINALYIYSMPLSEMARVIRIAELATLKLFGLNVTPYLNMIFIATILSSISAMIIAGPRVYFAMAEDGLFPRGIARVHARFGTPANAIILQGACSVILLFTGRFEQLLVRSGIVLIIFSALTVSAVLFLRKKNAGQERPYSAWAYPWTPLLFLLISVWILVTSFQSKLQDSLWALSIVACGIPFYFYWRREKARSGQEERKRTCHEEHELS